MRDDFLKKSEPESCSYSEDYNRIIHRFDMGSCVCRCGQLIVRKPVKRTRLKFGKQISDER
jgi:hypothetical protein